MFWYHAAPGAQGEGSSVLTVDTWRRRLLAGRAVGLLGHGTQDHILNPGPFGGANSREGPGPREGLGTSRMNPTPAVAARSELWQLV
jgi:hypothetical protein